MKQTHAASTCESPVSPPEMHKSPELSLQVLASQLELLQEQILVKDCKIQQLEEKLDEARSESLTKTDAVVHLQEEVCELQKKLLAIAEAAVTEYRAKETVERGLALDLKDTLVKELKFQRSAEENTSGNIEAKLDDITAQAKKLICLAEGIPNSVVVGACDGFKGQAAELKEALEGKFSELPSSLKLAIQSEISDPLKALQAEMKEWLKVREILLSTMQRREEDLWKQVNSLVREKHEMASEASSLRAGLEQLRNQQMEAEQSKKAVTEVMEVSVSKAQQREKKLQKQVDSLVQEKKEMSSEVSSLKSELQQLRGWKNEIDKWIGSDFSKQRLASTKDDDDDNDDDDDDDDGW